jgi:hypothetical protein
VLAFSADGDDAGKFVWVSHAKIESRVGTDAMPGKKDSIRIDVESLARVS